jgi:hypothetical protein
MDYSFPLFESPCLPRSSHSVSLQDVGEAMWDVLTKFLALTLRDGGDHDRHLREPIPISVSLDQFSSPPGRQLSC